MRASQAAAPAFPAPSPAMILEEIAASVGTTGARLIAERGSPARSAAKAHAAWLMREHGYSWPVIGRALGYAHHCSAISAVARWDRTRKARVS